MAMLILFPELKFTKDRFETHVWVDYTSWTFENAKVSFFTDRLVWLNSLFWSWGIFQMNSIHQICGGRIRDLRFTFCAGNPAPNGLQDRDLPKSKHSGMNEKFFKSWIFLVIF